MALIDLMMLGSQTNFREMIVEMILKSPYAICIGRSLQQIMISSDCW